MALFARGSLTALAFRKFLLRAVLAIFVLRPDTTTKAVCPAKHSDGIYGGNCWGITPTKAGKI
jgi:hypothetical protein